MRPTLTQSFPYPVGQYNALAYQMLLQIRSVHVARLYARVRRQGRCRC